MNQMTQNRCGGVPVAQNGNTKTRFFRKPIAALLMLLVFLGAGGKAWGQVTINWSGPVSATDYPTWQGTPVTQAVNLNGYICLPANSTIKITGNVTLNSPLLCWTNVGCGNITVENETSFNYQILSGFPAASGSQQSMFIAGFSGGNFGATLTINGGNGGITIDGNNYGNGVDLPSLITVHHYGICNLTNVTILRNQSVNGAAIVSVGTIECNKCQFGPSSSGNYINVATDGGGAIFNGGTATFKGCAFNYNSAPGINGGGAIYNINNGSITCEDYTSGGITTHCTFTGNRANRGGAINNDGNGSVICTNCVFNDNDVPTANGNFGGGILNGLNATLSCTGCSFSNNDAFVGGGVCSYGKVTVTNCTFTSNTASGSGGGNGGGLYQANSSTSNPSVVTSCEFSGNKANAGGAIFSSGYLRITEAGSAQTLIHNNEINSGGTGGGGIFTNGIVDMEAGKIYSNTTNIPNGGGVYVAVISSAGDFRLKGSSAIYSNTATGYGGGVYVESGATFTMSESSNIGTSGGNSATRGGGIYSEGTVTINGGQIVNNAISGNGGGAYVAGGTFSMSSGCIGTSGNANTANKGGGVYVGGGTFNLSGGNVQYNTNSGSDKHGAGIYLASGSVSMTGGKVNNNTGATQGGGVYVANGTFGLSSNGEIISNSAGSGGGVYQDGGIFNQSEGYIGKSGTGNGNTATSQGGAGLYLNSGTFNLSSGYISYNSGTGFGGGVRLEGGTLAMSGGQITNNTSSSNGGGVYKNAGTLRVTGAPVIKDNKTGNNANDVYFGSATATPKYLFIGAAGLQCDAEIGVYKSITGDYKIVEAEGSNRAANANYAMRNGFFFDDRGSSNIGSSTSSPYYNVSSYELYFVNGTAPAWSQTTQPSGYTVSGSTITISSAQGLAYMAHQVNSGADTYSGKTVQLSADIDLSGNKWVPIGYMTECDRDPLNPDEGFKGTFDGKGHTIYNMDCDHPFYDNAGLFGIVRGGTVKNLMVSGTITNASANLGGIVGEMIGGSVYNCMSSVTPTGGTNRGALVGKITNSGSLYNSFANSSSPLVGNNAGTVANCYVRGASSLVTTGTTANYCYASSGSASGTNGTFSDVETTRPYSYNCFDNQVTATATNSFVPTTTTANPDKQLVTTLNNWVAAQTTPNDYAGWVRPTTPRINGDYPILKMPGSDAVASNGDGNVLHYGAVSSTGNLLSTHTANTYAICLYNSVSTVASNSNSNAEFYINEDVAIGSGSGVNAHVGITLKDAAWHMFSPAIAAAPLGITYTDNTTDYGYNDPLPQVSFNTSEDGYFPHTNISGGGYYDSWDYYCYYEPEYHWINFKRNSNSHHHEDGNHEHINYTNETTLIPAKGYLLGTKLQTFLQSEGTLNDGNVSIALTSQSPLRTGYNFIGNPYQAYLDFDAFAENTANRNIWEGGNVTNASYVILESSGYMSYVHGASNNHFGADRYLHPHQGFMVVVKNGATSATFTNDMRSTTNTAAFRGDQVNYPLVNLIATEADGKRDITTVELGRPDQGGALKQYDLHLGKGSIYTHYGDDDYAIAFTQPGISEVGIRFETDEDATYTLSWDTENGEFSYLHLIDNITGIDTDCLTTSEYRFTAKTSDYKSRFKLVFGYTGIDEPETPEPVEGPTSFAFLMGNELVVNCGPSTSSGTATLQMFDLMGRMMMERHVSGTQTSIMMPDMPAGVYVLRLSGNNGTRTQKIVME